ncbi:MAG TPA: hypothetical protein GXZ85_03665 [Firmicutes bacterium]|jgi:hypothetical protein|nr:hypothetical protein [Bacillota bacterium]
MRGKLLIVLVVALLMVTGCSGERTSQSAAEAPVVQAASVAVPETFVNFGENEPARISGDEDATYNIFMEEGPYLFRMKSKDVFEGLNRVKMGVTLYSWQGAGLDESGWHVYESIHDWYSSGENEIVIEAEGEYEIEIHRLPLTDSPQKLPKTWSLLGTRVVGPFEAAANLTFKIRTEDAKNAGFLVRLLDAETGLLIENLYINVDPETRQGINTVDTEVAVDLSGPGRYLVEVGCNRECYWEVSASE